MGLIETEKGRARVERNKSGNTPFEAISREANTKNDIPPLNSADLVGLEDGDDTSGDDSKAANKQDEPPDKAEQSDIIVSGSFIGGAPVGDTPDADTPVGDTLDADIPTVNAPDNNTPTAQKKKAANKDHRLPIPIRRMRAIIAFLGSRYGLPIIHSLPEKAWRREKYPFPLMLQNSCGTLWVDRDYIAYMLDDDVIRYAYVTKKHIREEAICPGRPDYKLPDDVRRAFAVALRMMRWSNEPFCILPDFQEEKASCEIAGLQAESDLKATVDNRNNV